MAFWKSLFKMTGWSADISVPYRDKAVICVAPHTSNWDFLIGLIAYRSVGRKANFLMKDFWFFFPLKYILKALGGIPVKRSSSQSLTVSLVEDFRQRDHLNLAVTPEGTRKPVKDWKTGFLRIAINAEVPIQLGILDYKNKMVLIKDEVFPSADIEEDMKAIRKYYASYKEAARYPEQFIA